ncbi:MAG TPA: hypothetical protein VH157_07705 [Bryobacteraceae bacterium]|jgi:hypothetical protein|nr:hypothetical protein [Bryobacteraceae bacterium]
MCNGPNRVNSALNAALRQLDATKAVVRKRQVELSQAIPGLCETSRSSRSWRIFYAKSGKLNRATKRYLVAVSEFNTACHSKLLDFVSELR